MEGRPLCRPIDSSDATERVTPGMFSQLSDKLQEIFKD